MWRWKITYQLSNDFHSFNPRLGLFSTILLLPVCFSGEFHLGYPRTELQGASWYHLLHWDCMREAQSKHRLSEYSVWLLFVLLKYPRRIEFSSLCILFWKLMKSKHNRKVLSIRRHVLPPTSIERISTKFSVDILRQNLAGEFFFWKERSSSHPYCLGMHVWEFSFSCQVVFWQQGGVMSWSNNGVRNCYNWMQSTIIV